MGAERNRKYNGNDFLNGRICGELQKSVEVLEKNVNKLEKITDELSGRLSKAETQLKVSRILSLITLALTLALLFDVSLKEALSFISTFLSLRL